MRCIGPAFLQQNAIPLLIAAAGGIGLWKFTDKALWLFQKYVRLLQLILTVGLMLGAVAYLCRLPLNIVPVLDAMNTVSGIAIFLLGSLPLVLLLQRLLNRPLTALGNRLQIGEDGNMGLLIGAVSPLPTLSMMSRMNETAKVINAAFLVSGASALGAHLAFVYSVNPRQPLPSCAENFWGVVLPLFLPAGSSAPPDAIERQKDPASLSRRLGLPPLFFQFLLTVNRFIVYAGDRERGAQAMTIREIQARTGLDRATVYYYERRALSPPPGRPTATGTIPTLT